MRSQSHFMDYIVLKTYKFNRAIDIYSFDIFSDDIYILDVVLHFDMLIINQKNIIYKHICHLKFNEYY